VIIYTSANMQVDKRYVKRRYFSVRQPGSLSSVSTFLKNSNYYDKDQIQNILGELKTYNLHRPVRKTFLRQPVMCVYKNYMWQADTIVYLQYKYQNRHFAYILLCVDCFSKQLHCQPMKKKTGDEVRNALRNIFEAAKATPELLMTDKGTEFYSKPVKDFLATKRIKLYSTKSVLKAQQAERAIRTLKSRIARLMTHSNSKNWVDSLQDIVKSINSTFHASIKMQPMQVTSKNESEVFSNLYDKFVRMKYKKPKYAVNDLVKIAKNRITFKKGYEAGYSEDTFKIIKILKRHPVNIYRLADSIGIELDANFHEEELIRVFTAENSDT